MSPHVEAIADEYTRYKALGEAAIAQLDDDELTLVASEGGNSIIAIVWHVAGNLESRFTDFRTSDGEKPWRDRDDEFVLRTVTKSALIEKWERGWRAVLSAIGELSDEDLLQTITIRVNICVSTRRCSDRSRIRRITSARSCFSRNRFAVAAGDV